MSRPELTASTKSRHAGSSRSPQMLTSPRGFRRSEWIAAGVAKRALKRSVESVDGCSMDLRVPLLIPTKLYIPTMEGNGQIARVGALEDMNSGRSHLASVKYRSVKFNFVDYLSVHIEPVRHEGIW
ncbi:unnamed protein product [Calypogeia fissa]